MTKHQSQPGCGERVAWSGMGRLILSRETKFSGVSMDREKHFSCSADHKQELATIPVDAQSAERDGKTRMHTLCV